MTQRRHSSTAPGTRPASARQQGALIGVLVEHEGGAREQGARRLVPRHQQREEEHEQLLLAERAAVDLAADQERDEVVTGMARLPRMCSTMKPESSPSDAIVSSGGRSGDSIAASDQRRKSARSVSAMPSSSAMTIRGKGAASSATKSISPVASTPSSRLDGRLADGLAQSGERPRREAPVDQAAEGGVLGRIHVQDGARRHTLPGWCRAQGIVDQRAPARAEGRRVAAQVADVGVARDHPEARCHGVDRVTLGASGPAPRSSRGGGRRWDLADRAEGPPRCVGRPSRSERTVQRAGPP